MFDTIGQAAKWPTGQTMPPKVEGPARAEAVEAQKVSQPEKEKNREQNIGITQEDLDDLKNDFEMIHRVGFKFSLHKESNRTVVRVINEDTQELIREIPSEEMLNIMSKIDEMMGVLFDRKA